ncbi:glutamate racemase [Campylobacter suis]|uniref:Glutamate racemase n=1 Tax=Campylobacter suis TaxID=2790657 RepID=A0ABM8Q2N6_9BACT|nr:glutamate racemase [Campylobacter suis]CAD7287079.1 Glutamate racemase 2 [Campylobacter suis]
MKIGFFDSGIGGLSVMNEAIRQLSGNEFLFFADKKNVPYGTKTKDEVINFSIEAVSFLIDLGAKAVVVACNTATSAAIVELRAKFSVPIIGMEPAVKRAVSLKDGKKTLVIATPITIAGQKLHELLVRTNASEVADLLALPRLVEFAESYEFESRRVREYLKSELAKFDLSEYGSLVLGCTHFNYFKDTLREILAPQTKILDGIDGTIKRLKSESGAVSLADKSSKVEYFYSKQKVNQRKELDRLAMYLKRLDVMREIE